MIQKVFYGSVNNVTTEVKDINLTEKLVLMIIVGIIFFIGVYPQPLIDLTSESVTNLMFKLK
jgi:NADH-quinone oxidoreductase subunit M